MLSLRWSGPLRHADILPTPDSLPKRPYKAIHMLGSNSIFDHFLSRFFTVALLNFSMIASAAPPGWWDGGPAPVIDGDLSPADPLGLATVGQAKWMAKNALVSLRKAAPAIANAVEADLVGSGKAIESWTAPTTPADIEKQHGALLIGQLKAISAPFYTRLNNAHPLWLEAQRRENGTHLNGSIFPWTATTTDANMTAATLGQLKAAFSLRFETLPGATPPAAIETLLNVDGEWSVISKDRNGRIVPGVALQLFHWPAADAQPSTTQLSTGTTNGAGTYTFNPAALASGDRVEVRMEANPGQRAYLPWIKGHETPATVISPGGSGLAIEAVLGKSRLDEKPDFTINPGEMTDGQLQKGDGDPVYTLEEFLVMDENSSFRVYYSKPEWTSTFPLGNTTIWRDFPGGNDVLDAYKLPYGQPWLLGEGFKNGGTIENPDEYYFELRTAFGDPSVQVKCQRNLFLYSPFHGWSENHWPVPDAHYEPEEIIFSDDVVNDWGSAALPYNANEISADSHFYGVDLDTGAHLFDPGAEFVRQVILGPVPCFVPVSVLAGGPFFYADVNSVKLCAELPFGWKVASSSFFHWNAATTSVDWAYRAPKLRMTATIDGTSFAEVSIKGGDSASPFGSSSSVLSENDGQFEMEFRTTFSEGHDFRGDFSVNVKAELMIAHGEGPQDYVPHNLGNFTTHFKYQSAPASFSPPELSKKQEDELVGRKMSVEGSEFSGGQRHRTLEPERRIGVNGQPATDSPTFVDALTGTFHHSESDFSLDIPGSDLSLSVDRQVTDTVWNDATGLLPEENPQLPFGPGWSSNLAASALRTRGLSPTGEPPQLDGTNLRQVRSNITVMDYRGTSYSFIEYQNESGQVSFLGDPTMLPSRETAGISILAPSENSLVLNQPVAGITHNYQKVTFFKKPNNRDTPNLGATNESGFTSYDYYRLINVTDRFGTKLVYSYSDASLIPTRISVEGRPELQLRIQQAGGRIVRFWDPAGVGHAYNYETRVFGTIEVPSQHSVMISHSAGSLETTTYGYRELLEKDPRPDRMLLRKSPGQPYKITTHHMMPDSITNGDGSLVVNYRTSTTRIAYSPLAKAFYTAVGDPLMVSSITLPDNRNVAFLCDHVLNPGRTAIPGDETTPAVPAVPPVLTINTQVTDLKGKTWIYNYGRPLEIKWGLPELDARCLPAASALYFPKLTRTSSEGSEEFYYDAFAGFATSHVKNAAGHSTRYAFTDEAPTPSTAPYRPAVLNRGERIHKHFPLPSSSTNHAGEKTTFSYTGNSKLVSTITDFRGRVTKAIRGPHSRIESLQKLASAGGQILSETNFSYSKSLPGAVTKMTQKALPGNGDPAWTKDIVQNIQLDKNGFPFRIGSSAGNLFTTVTRSPAGRVLMIQIPDGTANSYVYNAAGKLEKTCYSNGTNKYSQLSHSKSALISKDPLGAATGITYDTNGRPTSVVTDMNGNLSLGPSGSLTGIDQGTDLLIKLEYLDSESEIRRTDPRGFITVYRFDTSGRLSKVIEPENDRSVDTLPTEASDRVTEYIYDIAKSPAGPVKIVDPMGFETLIDYDPKFRPSRILREYGTDTSGNRLYSGRKFGYDVSSGLLSRIHEIRTPLDSSGNPAAGAISVKEIVTAYTYDSSDRLKTLTNAYGTDKELTVRYSYTSNGLLFKTEVRDSLAAGGNPEHWSALEVEFDSLRRPIKKILPSVTDATTGLAASPAIEMSYDAAGRLEAIKDPYGNQFRLGYDYRGNLAYKRSPAVQDALSGQSGEPLETFEYDAAGRLKRSVDPLGRDWTYDRDPAGRVTRITGPLADASAPPARQRPVWEFKYDLAGNMTRAIDPESRATTSAFYPDNLVATVSRSVTFTDAGGIPFTENVTERYRRNELGMLTRLIDGKNQMTDFGFDGLGRPVSKTSDPESTRSRTQTTTYDAMMPISSESANRQVKNFTYNDQFLLATLDVEGKPAESLQYTYDLLGSVTSVVPPVPIGSALMGNPAVSRTYDAIGNVGTETSNGITSTYGYDLNGLLAKVTSTARAGAITLQRDGMGRATQVVDTTGGAPLATNTAFDLGGNLIRKSITGGVSTGFEYDPLGRVVKEVMENSAASVACRTDYEYDLVSNVTRIEEHSAALNVPHRIIENTYNERDQLLSEVQTETGGSLGGTVHTRTETHRYDQAENRISTFRVTSDGTTTANFKRDFVYGASANGKGSNQLHELIETINAGTPVVSSFTYDDNGNRIGKAIGSASDTYHYDSHDRLVGLDLNTAGSTENGSFTYAYDSLSRRITRRAGTDPARQFSFADSTPVYEWDTSASATTMTGHVGGGIGGRLYSRDASGTTIHPFHNVRGDVVAETSPAGVLAWHGSWSSEGLLERQAGTRSGNYGANGKWEEPGGLVNDGLRYRDRSTSSFISRDPAGFIDGPNVYNYVRHNPWSACDPNGLATISVPESTADIGFVRPGNSQTNLFPTTGIPRLPVSDSIMNTRPATFEDLYPFGIGAVDDLVDTFSDHYVFNPRDLDLPELMTNPGVSPNDNSPSSRLWDVIEGTVDLPGKTFAWAFNVVTAADITSAPLEYDGMGKGGFRLGEPHSNSDRILLLGLALIPGGRLEGRELREATETVYRAMSEREFKGLELSGILSKRPNGSSSLGITEMRFYVENDLSRRTSNAVRKYTHVVEFTLPAGTFDRLISMGGATPSIIESGAFPKRVGHLLPWSPGMAQVKLEKGNVLSILLGHSPEALNAFNSSIISFQRIR